MSNSVPRKWGDVQEKQMERDRERDQKHATNKDESETFRRQEMPSFFSKSHITQAFASREARAVHRLLESLVRRAATRQRRRSSFSEATLGSKE